MPRPKLRPTEEQRQLVKNLAAVGIPQEDIARKIGIRSPKTLREHFREELDLAVIDANASVGGALYKSAMKGNVEAQKFWLIARAAWRPSLPHSSTGELPPFIISVKNDAEKSV